MFIYMMWISVVISLVSLGGALIGYQPLLGMAVQQALVAIVVYILLRQRLREHYTGFWNLRKDIYAEYNSRPEPEKKNS